MSPIRLGVVGLSVDGWFKQAHLPALKQLADSYTLVAAATSRQESADHVAEQYKVKSYGGHDSSEQIARDADVDMVVVAIKTPMHKQIAMPIIEAGKNVYLEWPLGKDLQEAIELAEAANKRGVRTMIGLQARQDLAIRKAKELLEQGTIGEILSTNLTAYGGAWAAQVTPRDTYLLDEKNGATLLSIPFGHFIDAFVYLLGDFESLSAYKAKVRTAPTVNVETGEKVQGTAPDQLVVQGQLESGALAALHYKAGMAPDGSQGLMWEIEGDKGVLTFKADGFGHIQIAQPKLYLDGKPVELPEEKLGSVGRLYQAFANDDKSGYNDWDHAVKNHRILDAVERSVKEGKRQSYL